VLKALVVLLWPLGIAIILGGTALVAKRSVRRSPPATAPMNGHHGNDPLVGVRTATSSITGMLLILVVGAMAVYALTSVVGVLIVHTGPTIDKPIYYWMIHHQVHFWTLTMERLTKVGNTWTTWGAAVAAAVCLAAFYRNHKWLPPVALGAAIFIDHYLTLALRHVFHRIGPPDSPLGTFPSGGCDRIFVFYGLIAYLIWREVSGSRRVAVWSAGAIAALGFSEGYSRGYLMLHWFTDIISGMIYGCLILAVFIATIRVVVGPARTPAIETVPGVAALAGQQTPTLQ
jgi:membrane-associated phospholipid phosphatase